PLLGTQRGRDQHVGKRGGFDGRRTLHGVTSRSWRWRWPDRGAGRRARRRREKARIAWRPTARALRDVDDGRVRFDWARVAPRGESPQWDLGRVEAEGRASAARTGNHF